ncbi:MAG: hypothetical protein U0166_12750 [Acidobacteriota bacterium]
MARKITLSRACPEFLVKLFEMEVPEIYDGTVIRRRRARAGRAREDRRPRASATSIPGRVRRHEGLARPGRDPRAGGEKIDIVEYAEDISQFAMNASTPRRSAAWRCRPRGEGRCSRGGGRGQQLSLG